MAVEQDTSNDKLVSASSDTTSLPAVLQFFSTTELLENILLYLQLKTLLCFKRVSRQFRDTMIGSLKIKRALFFEPLSTAATVQTKLIYNNTGEGLPLEVSHVMPANPLLDRFLSYNVNDWYAAPDDPNLRATIDYTYGVNQLYALQHSANSKTASWRQMLVIQPHAAPMLLQRGFWCDKNDEPSRNVESRSGLEGLRMGDFVTMLLDDSERERVSCFQLSPGVKVALGRYDEDTVDPLYRSEVIGGICGWDVLNPGFGKELEEHPEML